MSNMTRQQASDIIEIMKRIEHHVEKMNIILGAIRGNTRK